MAEESETVVVTEPVPGVRVVTLNRPDKLNALTFVMVDELHDRLEALRYDPGARVVVLTGAGRGFCSGHDRSDHDDPEWLPPRPGRIQRGMLLLSRMSRLPVLMRSLPQPVISAVNGPASGAGMPIALAADIVLAGESAFFVNGFLNTGGGGAELGLSHILPRLIGPHRAAEMMLTSRRVGAEEAARIGLVTRTVPDGDLIGEATRVASEIATLPPLSVAQTKAALWSNAEVPGLAAAMELELRGQVLVQQTADARERKDAAAGKRPPRYTGR